MNKWVKLLFLFCFGSILCFTACGAAQVKSITIAVPNNKIKIYKDIGSAYEREHPEIKLHFVGMPTANLANENRTTDLIQDAKTDLYIISEESQSYLIRFDETFLEKNFLDAKTLLENSIADNTAFFSEVIKASRTNRKQYVIPLAFQLTGVLTSEQLIDPEQVDALKKEQTPLTFLDTMTDCFPSSDCSYLCRAFFSGNVITCFDLQTETAAAGGTLYRLCQKVKLLHQDFSNENREKTNDSLCLPEKTQPLYADVIGAPSGLEQKAQMMLLQDKESKPVLIAFPNETSGTTAVVTSFALISNETAYPKEVGDFIKDVLLSTAVQGNTGGEVWGTRSTIAPTALFNLALPIRKDALPSALKYAGQYAGAL